MTSSEQIRFECAQTGKTALVVFVPFIGVTDAQRESFGLNCARNYHGLLTLAGVGCTRWILSYAESGVVVFFGIAEADTAKALSEILLAFSRFGTEDQSWCAQCQGDTWKELFPTRGAVRELPAEVRLLPNRFYQLQSDLAMVRAAQEELRADSQQIQEALASGRLIDTVVGDEGHQAKSAWCEERLAAIEAEMATLKIAALGLHEQS